MFIDILIIIISICFIISGIKQLILSRPKTIIDKKGFTFEDKNTNFIPWNIISEIYLVKRRSECKPRFFLPKIVFTSSCIKFKIRTEQLNEMKYVKSKLLDFEKTLTNDTYSLCINSFNTINNGDLLEKICNNFTEEIRSNNIIFTSYK